MATRNNPAEFSMKPETCARFRANVWCILVKLTQTLLASFAKLLPVFEIQY